MSCVPKGHMIDPLLFMRQILVNGLEGGIRVPSSTVTSKMKRLSSFSRFDFIDAREWEWVFRHCSKENNY
jgi:hypothetical protein